MRVLFFCMLCIAVALCGPQVQITNQRISGTEGGAGPLSTLQFTFSRDGNTVAALTVTFVVTGTANNLDYSVPANGNPVGLPATYKFPNGGDSSVIIPAGQSSAQVTLQIIDDNVFEGLKAETVIITIKANAAYTIKTNFGTTGTLSIVDNEAQPTVSVAPKVGGAPGLRITEAATAAPESHSRSMTFTRTDTGGDLTVVVQYTAPAAGIAGKDTDFLIGGTSAVDDTNRRFQFIITNGQATHDISITAQDDQVAEGTEAITFEVIANPDGTGLYKPNVNAAQRTVAFTIIDDDPPDLKLLAKVGSATSVLENSGTKMTMTLSRVGNFANALVVDLDFSVAGTKQATRTAGANQDFTTLPNINGGTATIPGGQKSIDIVFTITNDGTIEFDETIAVKIKAKVGTYTFSTPDFVTFTIINDDKSLLNMALNLPSALEDIGTEFKWTITRKSEDTAINKLANALVVKVTVAGTATVVTDYALPGSLTVDGAAPNYKITIPAGASSVDIAITPKVDAVKEPDESISVIIRADAANYLFEPATAIVATIINDDPPIIKLVVSANTIKEDDPANVVYTFSRTNSLKTAVDVTFEVTGTLSETTDYAISGTKSYDVGAGKTNTGVVTIPVDKASATVVLAIVADAVIEPDEVISFKLRASAAVPAKYEILATSTAAVLCTVQNDDPSVSVVITNATKSVFEDSGSEFEFTFTRTGSTTNALNVQFNVAGTATLNSDYKAPTGPLPLTFAAGAGTQSSIQIPAGSDKVVMKIKPEIDSTVEPDETIIVTVSGVGGSYFASTTKNSALATIKNDDGANTITLTLNPSTAAENSGTKIKYTFTRTAGPTAQNLVVNFIVTGSATITTDYTAATSRSTDLVQFIAGPTQSSLTIPTGQTTSELLITPLADTITESSETVIITLASGGYTIAAGSSGPKVATISNVNTPSLTVFASPASLQENTGSKFTFTIRAAAAVPAALQVSFAMGGTATINGDYTINPAIATGTTGAVTIAAGQTTAIVEVTPKADSTPENDETVILTITPAAAYVIATSSASVTITNDDGAASSISVAAVAGTSTKVSEGLASGSFQADFKRTGATTGVITVEFKLTGVAKVDTDYTVSGQNTLLTSTGTGTIIFAAGDTTKRLTFTIKNDLVVEPDEDIVCSVVIDKGTTYGLGTPNSVNFVIVNDDKNLIGSSAPFIANEITSEVLEVSGLKNKKRQITATDEAIRVAAANYLGVDVTFIGVAQNLGFKTIVFVAKSIGGNSKALALQLVGGINGNDIALAGTPLQGAIAFYVGDDGIPPEAKVFAPSPIATNLFSNLNIPSQPSAPPPPPVRNPSPKAPSPSDSASPLSFSIVLLAGVLGVLVLFM